MDDKHPEASLLEGAYAMTPTHPGFWLNYEELCRNFEALLKQRGLSIANIDTFVREHLPDAEFNAHYKDKITGESFLAVKAPPENIKKLQTLRRTIESALREIEGNDEGWKEFAPVGLRVDKDLYALLGFKALSHAVMALFPTRMEFRKGDISLHEAPLYIRDAKAAKNAATAPLKKPTPRKLPSEKNDRALLNFAYFPRPRDYNKGNGFDFAIEQLQERALPERWYYDERNKDRSPVLREYVYHTFERLRYEDDVERAAAAVENRAPAYKIIEGDEYAIWNTGLVDNLYDPIYAFFKRNDGRNEHVTQKWMFVSFNTANSSMNTTFSQFPEPPRKAAYFQNVRELIYDTAAGEPILNWEHLIRDNIKRFPTAFVLAGANDKFAVAKNPENLTPTERTAYYARLAEAIESDPQWKRRLTNDFKEALRTALARVDWNYKTAIPVYFPKEKKMQLLLPLALVDPEAVDVALLCNHVYDESRGINNYEGRTIFTLAMAYNNARLIARPDSDWLTVNSGSPTAADDEEDFETED